MSRLFQPLLFLFAKCTKNELIRQLEFLKAENEILRKRVPQKRIHLNAEERSRLLKLGQAIGPGLKHLLTIVSYQTFLKWVRDRQENYVPKKTGRPKTRDELRELIVKMARETGWGYTRIMGELKKLGIKPPSRSTVKNILKAHNLDLGPKPGQGTWNQFLIQHAETLWQCDFFSKNIWTPLGMRQYFALVFLHVGTRKVYITKCSKKPDAAWVKARAEEFVKHFQTEEIPSTILMRDRDCMYSQGFDEVLKAQGIDVKRNVFRSPNLNAYVERFIQSLQQECLDHFIVFGEKHFDHLVAEYVDYYLHARPHQALENVPLTGEWPEPMEMLSSTGAESIVCTRRLGGVLRHYVRRAA
ncbi:MAG: integrase core domain-containing protein [Planctomycetaceae bacterium]